jgi:hypothetical protein
MLGPGLLVYRSSVAILLHLWYLSKGKCVTWVLEAYLNAFSSILAHPHQALPSPYHPLPIMHTQMTDDIHSYTHMPLVCRNLYSNTTISGLPAHLI